LIIVVCLNPALDVTYHVEELVPGSSHRVVGQHERAGGKGLNVARVLHQLGSPAVVLGLSGGHYGSVVAGEIAAAGLDARWTPIAESTRRTVTVVDSAATLFLEAGPACSAAEWSSFVASYQSVLDSADVVVLSGSLPNGLPPDAYAELIALAGDRRTILDTDGAGLVPGLAARPYLAKPNAAEAANLGGDVAAVLQAGARNALVSEGSEGLSASLDGRRFRVSVPHIAGNPTGAGDALTAGLAAGIAAGGDWHVVLRSAAAIAAGAVALPYAGAFDAAVADDVRPLIKVEELT
jgi:tagatose 6-phosphate kinase